MLISDYLSSNIIICILFLIWPTYFREVGQKYRNIFDRFLVQMKTSKSHSEIKWPLQVFHITVNKIWNPAEIVRIVKFHAVFDHLTNSLNTQ